ncbi:MAG: nucleotidyltransferase domain-containing protein [bacterium]
MIGLNLNQEEQAALRDLKARLANEVGPVTLLLFGSKVKGEGTPESDLDVFIQVPEYTFEIESIIDDIIFEINLRHGVFISSVIFGENELAGGPLSESPLYKNVRSHGVRL